MGILLSLKGGVIKPTCSGRSGGASGALLAEAISSGDTGAGDEGVWGGFKDRKRREAVS